jgi:lysophospholipid acyltransferase (LPLAT)-like uncharacterized protein
VTVFLRRLVGWLAGIVAWLLSRTYRNERIGDVHRVRAHDEGGGALFAIFHEQQMHAITLNPESQMVTIASRSKDGDIIAAALSIFSVRAARGSSSRGGGNALTLLRRWVSKGASCAITIDGPRGPRRKAKAGIVQLARLTGRPIVPTVFVAQNVWRFRSWDRFEVAKPFSRVLSIFGEPLRTRDDASIEDVCAALDNALRALDEDGRARLGRQAEPLI